MKNINSLVLLLCLVGVFLFSCEEPLDDLYDELDKAAEGGAAPVLDFEYTLGDDDYALVDKSFGNFNSSEEARQLIPIVLSNAYPDLGTGSSAIVTYAQYNGSSPYLLDEGGNEATVSSAEYTALGYTYGNFDDLEADLPIYAAYKMPNAVVGTYIDVTHEYYNGAFTENDVISRVVKTAPYGWVYVYELNSDLYMTFFEESHSNFSNTDEAEVKIPVYLLEWFKFAEAGDTKLVQYIYYDNGVIEDLAHYTFDGQRWILYGDGYQVTNEVLQFGYNGSAWVPDNTIKYTLGYTDWEYIATNWESRNASGASSVSSYRNFDVSLWTNDQIFQAITEVLGVIYPNTEEGQKYLVTYATYSGSVGSVDLSVIYKDGAYELNED